MLKRAFDLEVNRRRGRERPKMTWKRKVKEQNSLKKDVIK